MGLSLRGSKAELLARIQGQDEDQDEKNMEECLLGLEGSGFGGMSGGSSSSMGMGTTGSSSGLGIIGLSNSVPGLSSSSMTSILSGVQGLCFGCGAALRGPYCVSCGLKGGVPGTCSSAGWCCPNMAFCGTCGTKARGLHNNTHFDLSKYSAEEQSFLSQFPAKLLSEVKLGGYPAKLNSFVRVFGDRPLEATTQLMITLETGRIRISQKGQSILWRKQCKLSIISSPSEALFFLSSRLEI